MKIYFAGSIRGGRNDAEKYNDIIGYLKKFGDVLTVHVGDKNLLENGEDGVSEEYIYKRDMDWLTESDILIADVTVPSLGVGFEIAKATELNLKIVCLYEKIEGKTLSAMIKGCPNIAMIEYSNINEVKEKLDQILVPK